MITDGIVEAMELLERMSQDDAQRQGIRVVKEMLCDWSEEEWVRMSAEERKTWLAPFLQERPDIPADHGR